MKWPKLKLPKTRNEIQIQFKLYHNLITYINYIRMFAPIDQSYYYASVKPFLANLLQPLKTTSQCKAQQLIQHINSVNNSDVAKPKPRPRLKPGQNLFARTQPLPRPKTQQHEEIPKQQENELSLVEQRQLRIAKIKQRKLEQQEKKEEEEEKEKKEKKEKEVFSNTFFPRRRTVINQFFERQGLSPKTRYPLSTQQRGSPSGEQKRRKTRRTMFQTPQRTERSCFGELIEKCCRVKKQIDSLDKRFSVKMRESKKIYWEMERKLWSQKIVMIE